MSATVFDAALRTRGLTSILYVLAWCLALFVHPYVFVAVMVLAFAQCVIEYKRMQANTGGKVSPWMAGFEVFIFCLFAYRAIRGDAVDLTIAMLLAGVFLLVGTLMLFFSSWTDKRTSAARLSYFLYPGSGFMSLLILAFPGGLSPGGFDYQVPLILLVLIWANDSVAYITGRAFGKTALWPSISPKKTVEGAVGGLLGTALLAWLFHLIVPDFSLTQLLAIAFVVAIFSPLGDLFESQIKRRAGVKDSGRWLPGHGGLLDRLDSLLWVAPAYFILHEFFFS